MIPCCPRFLQQLLDCFPLKLGESKQMVGWIKSSGLSVLVMKVDLSVHGPRVPGVERCGAGCGSNAPLTAPGPLTITRLPPVPLASLVILLRTFHAHSYVRCLALCRDKIRSRLDHAPGDGSERLGNYQITAEAPGGVSSNWL